MFVYYRDMGSNIFVFVFEILFKCMEGRFGLYRQLSGCNYLVSVKDVMYSERKL